jgi:hypothetical protein
VTTATTALRSVGATRYVTPLREGGSLPGLVEADDDGLYVVKFRGAGQGPLALVAEVIAGELGRALGLPVPELVSVELPDGLASAEPDVEVQELLQRSVGLNLGVDFLPGALPYVPGVSAPPPPEEAAATVWLDALTLNVDRTPRNPNLLVWHGRVWLIDHGAALHPHHQGLDPVRDAARPYPLVAEHALLGAAAPLSQVDERLAALLHDAVLEGAVAMVPDAWLGDDGASARDAYVTFLRERLRAPRAFVAEAERARGGYRG